MVEYIEAQTTEEFEEAKILFNEYISSLGVDLTFQNVEEELSKVNSIYRRPSGSLILVLVDGTYAGCIALRKLETGICEMKRLYIKPEFRGMKLGGTLAEKIIAIAKSLGYEQMRLDTLPTMLSARGLYKKIGFYEIEPYYESPIEGTAFMELALK